jgi:predicted NBD/HSP70 family sugar kinase
MAAPRHTQDVRQQFRRGSGRDAASASERLLLHLVRKAGVLSRADLTRACGFSGPGAKTLIDGLVERGLLRLGPAEVKGRGQPSATISLAPRYAYSIGLSVMVDCHRLTLMDFAGRVVAERFDAAFPNRLESVARHAKRDIHRMLTKAKVAQDQVFGIGLSMTGPFVADGSRVNPPLSMPDEWATTELDRYFAAALGHPVWMDNDANCAATAEALFGVGRRVDSFVYLHFTDGFGGGVIHDGKLLRGSHGNAGEFGRLFAMTALKRPTLEGLRERLLAAGHALPDLHTMLEAYDPTWPEIDAWIDSVREGLTLVVAAITALFDPALIVLGARLPSDLATRLAATVRFEAAPRRGMSTPNPAVVCSDVPANATGMGAAFLPLKEHFFL